MKKSFFTLLVLSFIVCSCDNENDPKPDDNNGNGDCTNSFVNRNDSIIITGCSNYEPVMPFEEAGYILQIKSKEYESIDNVEIYVPLFDSYTSLISGAASALHNDGWYSQATVLTHSSGEWKYKITADGEYHISFAKLPLNVASVSLPANFAAKGMVVEGPFQISGNATFTVSCPDAKQAGFVVELYNAETGDDILDSEYHPVLNMLNLDENYNQINNYSKTSSVALSGIYLVKVSANADAAWTLQIE